MGKLYVGIDAGSTAVKVVALSEDGSILYKKVEETEPLLERQAERILKELKENFPGLSFHLTATGYGANLIQEADKRVTEISCHAKGAYFLLKREGTVVDIGGQDSKVILVGAGGRVMDFAMNDKCAAGTGRFLENIAWRLKLSLEEMEHLALSVQDEVSISSTCVVFAESEVISMLARGVDLAKVVRGIHRALVRRVVAMLHSLPFTPPIILTGGIAKSRAIRKMMEDEIKEKVIVPEDPQIVGAIGAALSR